MVGGPVKVLCFVQTLFLFVCLFVYLSSTIATYFQSSATCGGFFCTIMTPEKYNHCDHDNGTDERVYPRSCHHNDDDDGMMMMTLIMIMNTVKLTLLYLS